MADLKAQFLAQLDDVLKHFEDLKRQAGRDNYMNISMSDHSMFATKALAAIDRIAGPDSSYGKQARNFDAMKTFNYEQIPYLAGVVVALRGAVESGYLTSARELIHANVFSDFLEMADYLLGEGYKDPAAMMGGGVLEVHLHQLCAKHGIAIEKPGASPAQSKRAEQLNDELKAADVYSKLDHKSVTWWLDLRNKAAHAEYHTYTKEQVALFLQGIRDFVVRCPA